MSGYAAPEHIRLHCASVGLAENLKMVLEFRYGHWFVKVSYGPEHFFHSQPLHYNMKIPSIFRVFAKKHKFLCVLNE